jgi:dTDP-4-amino-4,6-dideoxygalactose transaminase
VGILSRSYFYPLISDMPMYRGMPSADPVGLPQAKQIASKVLCLPIYPDLPLDVQTKVIELLRRGV